jgi:hypothetical protein
MFSVAELREINKGDASFLGLVGNTMPYIYASSAYIWSQIKKRALGRLVKSVSELRIISSAIIRQSLPLPCSLRKTRTTDLVDCYFFPL